MLQQYLITTIIGILIEAGLIVFSNLGFLPCGVLSFAFLSLLVFFFALLRPRFLFWIFIMLFPLENIIVSPEGFPLSLRPFQFVGIILILATILLWMLKKLEFKLLSFQKICLVCNLLNKNCSVDKTQRSFNNFDRLVFIFPIFSLLAVFNAQSKATPIKQSLVLVSFVALYWLARNYLQTQKQKFEALWFFLAGSKIVILYGIWQAVAFKFGWPHFEVMDGRINSTFTEPDWLGIYLAFLVALVLWTKLAFKKTKNQTMAWNWELGKVANFLLNIYLFFVFASMMLTVARSGWLGMAGVVVLYILMFGFMKFIEKVKTCKEVKSSKFKVQSYSLKFKVLEIFKETLTVGTIGVCAVLFVVYSGLSSFHFANRAASSVSGKQKITVSCFADAIHESPLPVEISSTDELSRYGCRHINLEEIESEKQQGRVVSEVYRPDPNVDIRKNIYLTSWQEIKKHPILGQGLGSSALILGSDERGAGLNTSNIFLETWLSMGIGGLLILLAIFIMPSILALKNIIQKRSFLESSLILLATAAFFIPNLFNTGLFLGIFWAYLALISGVSGMTAD